MFSKVKHGIKNTWLFLYTLSSNSVSNTPILVKNADTCKNKYILKVQVDGRLK